MSRSPVFFEVGPFPVPIVILTKKKHVKEAIKRMGIKNADSLDLSWQAYGGRVTMLENIYTGSSIIIVMIDAGNIADKPIVARINTYSHEATHVCQFLMDAIGEEKPGVEVEAYCVGYVTEKIYETLEKAIVKSE